MMVGTVPTVVEVLAVLSVEEKAALTSGGSFFATKAAAGRREIVLSDGPHGVRASSGGAGDHLGISPSLPATCFPPGAGLAQSWDPDLAREIGAALAREARHRGVSVLLGPAVNVRRDPRCGRNFEYHSEDPVLAGDLGAAWVQGLQWEGVGASVKHFAANNAEFDRMRSNSSVDPRALREIYLKVFERIVKQAHPWTVMCSYNRINGVYASENEWLLRTCCAESGALTAWSSLTGERFRTEWPLSAAGLTWPCPPRRPSLTPRWLPQSPPVKSAARNLIRLRATYYGCSTVPQRGRRSPRLTSTTTRSWPVGRPPAASSY